MAVRMLRDGYIHRLGSDCHNTGERQPNLGEAMACIEKKLGIQSLERVRTCAQQILEL